MHKPKFITFTGADEHTSHGAMAHLASQYPIEWGVLFSPSRQGTGRYPPLWWVEGLLVQQFHSDMRLAAHICGGHSRALLEPYGKTDVDDLIRGSFARVQINTSNPDPDLDQVLHWSADIHATPILQCREEFPPTEAVSWLFDASGGRGIEPKNWPCAARFVGYAGGLNPGNVVQHLERISEGASQFWLDMESGVRDENDRFDLGKCRAVCEAVYGTSEMMYRDMTEAQLLAWGAAEAEARIADLAAAKSAEGLKAAQVNAEGRRKAIGATRGQASDAVIRAQRAARNGVT